MLFPQRHLTFAGKRPCVKAVLFHVHNVIEWELYIFSVCACVSVCRDARKRPLIAAFSKSLLSQAYCVVVKGEEKKSSSTIFPFVTLSNKPQRLIPCSCLNITSPLSLFPFLTRYQYLPRTVFHFLTSIHFSFSTGIHYQSCIHILLFTSLLNASFTT